MLRFKRFIVKLATVAVRGRQRPFARCCYVATPNNLQIYPKECGVKKETWDIT